MSYQNPRIYSFLSGADLSGKQFYLVRFEASEDGKKVVLAGANEKAIGAIANQPASGEDASIEVYMFGGGGKVKISEAIEAGELLTPTSTGLAEQVDAADEWCCAIAMEDGAANDVIAVEFVAMYSSKSDA